MVVPVLAWFAVSILMRQLALLTHVFMCETPLQADDCVFGSVVRLLRKPHVHGCVPVQVSLCANSVNDWHVAVVEFSHGHASGLGLCHRVTIMAY